MHSHKKHQIHPFNLFESQFSYGSESLVEEHSLKEVFTYHNQTGGSRTRAKLAFECGANADLPDSTMIRLANACELLHQASLLHDDIMDDDRCRRGSEAVWSKYGQPSAICLGDELIAEAFAQLAGVDAQYLNKLPDLIRYTQKAICQSAAGQVLDCSLKGESNVSLECYEKASGNKSGPLLALPLALTMIVKSEQTECFTCLSEISSAFGTAYQLLDDLEDRETDKGNQLNGYWVLYALAGSHEGAKGLIRQRYDWYRRVILRGLECLPVYCHGGLNFFYSALANKAQTAGIVND